MKKGVRLAENGFNTSRSFPRLPIELQPGSRCESGSPQSPIHAGAYNAMDVPVLQQTAEHSGSLWLYHASLLSSQQEEFPKCFHVCCISNVAFDFKSAI